MRLIGTHTLTHVGIYFFLNDSHLDKQLTERLARSQTRHAPSNQYANEMNSFMAHLNDTPANGVIRIEIEYGCRRMTLCYCVAISKSICFLF